MYVYETLLYKMYTESDCVPGLRPKPFWAGSYLIEKVGIVSEGEISIERKPEKRWLLMWIKILSETFILEKGFEL